MLPVTFRLIEMTRWVKKRWLVMFLGKATAAKVFRKWTEKISSFKKKIIPNHHRPAMSAESSARVAGLW